jgi:hypothetical protein
MKKDFDTLNSEEVAKRHDEAIRRALGNMPKEQREFIGKSAKSSKIATSIPQQSALKGGLFKHHGR